MGRVKQRVWGCLAFAALVGTGAFCRWGLADATTQPATQPETLMARVPITFAGGHETEGRDRGRPDVLIAAALGVPTQVFRNAFSHVHPAGPGQQPSEGQVRENKRMLMAALGPYGVTDDRLNEVSNHYRYRRDQGELWPTRTATGVALVRDGKIFGFALEDGGTGYSSPPAITLPGFPDVPATATLHFGKNFNDNGGVSVIKIGTAIDGDSAAVDRSDK